MKSLRALISSFFRPKAQPEVDTEAMAAVVARLEAAGFYRHTDPDAAAKAKARAIESGAVLDSELGEVEDGSDQSTQRVYFADAEELAEGGVKELLGKIAPFLQGQEVALSGLEQECGEEGYTVSVNGVRYEMYSKAELEKEEIWRLTTIRALGMINHLLEEAKSGERAYSLYGGNEGLVVLLTPTLHHILTECASILHEGLPEDLGRLGAHRSQ